MEYLEHRCGLGVVERGAGFGADAAREDDGSAASRAADDGKSDVDAGTAEVCLDKAPATEIHRLAEQAENELLPKQDPEMKYLPGHDTGGLRRKSRLRSRFCARPWPENYCAHQALQSDPLLAGVREDAEFRQIVQAAAECQQKFAVAQGMR